MDTKGANMKEYFHSMLKDPSTTLESLADKHTKITKGM